MPASWSFGSDSSSVQVYDFQTGVLYCSLSSYIFSRTQTNIRKRCRPMSGHSKWHTIKHQQGALDAKRGKLFTKWIKEITIAARTGRSGDPNQNPRLRKAVNDAKAGNMPNDTIDRAIKRGTGELEGVNYEEITYEGYGPGGVAVMVNATTDNRNRTVSELRHLFSKNSGNLGESGSVAWMFNKKGQIIVDSALKSEDDMMEIAIIPQNTIKLDSNHAAQMLKLYDALDDHEDVQSVYANFEIDDAVMQQQA